MRGAGRIHPLVVKDDLHPQTVRALYDKADRLKISLRQIRDILRDPDPGMQHDGVHAFFLIILQFPQDFPLVRPVIEEPERNRGELLRRVFDRPEKLPASFLFRCFFHCSFRHFSSCLFLCFFRHFSPCLFLCFFRHFPLRAEAFHSEVRAPGEQANNRTRERSSIERFCRKPVHPGICGTPVCAASMRGAFRSRRTFSIFSICCWLF